MTPAPEYLDPSPLGTKQYWDNAYEQEIENQMTVSSDEGNVWFSDADAEQRVLFFLDQLTRRENEPHKEDDGTEEDDGDEEEEDSEEEEEEDYKMEYATECTNGTISLSKDTASILDLGTGNGHMVFSLRQAGWKGRLVGVDYSSNSVALAKRIALTRAGRGTTKPEGEEGEPEGGKVKVDERMDIANIEFHEWDIFSPSSPSPPASSPSSSPPFFPPATGFDIVHDKGTFDAISLCSDVTASGARLCDVYPRRAIELVRPGGVFVITSCNWTEDELREWFEFGLMRRASGGGSGGDADGEGSELDEKSGNRKASPSLKVELIARVVYPTFSFGGSVGQQVTTLCFQRAAS